MTKIQKKCCLRARLVSLISTQTKEYILGAIYAFSLWDTQAQMLCDCTSTRMHLNVESFLMGSQTFLRACNHIYGFSCLVLKKGQPGIFLNSKHCPNKSVPDNFGTPVIEPTFPTLHPETRQSSCSTSCPLCYLHCSVLFA